jgi:hypothetical protein
VNDLLDTRPGPPDGEALAAALIELYPFALSITRDPDLAADLIQDAWLRASRSVVQWRGDAPLASWLRRIIHNLAIDFVRALLEVGLPAAKQRLRRGRMMLVTAISDGHERRENLKGVPMRCWDARQHVSEYLNGDLDTEPHMRS